MTTDISISCLTCGDSFVWTGRQQEQYKERDWDKPLRCARCRELRHQQRAQAALPDPAAEAAGERSVDAFQDFNNRPGKRQDR